MKKLLLRRCCAQQRGARANPPSRAPSAITAPLARPRRRAVASRAPAPGLRAQPGGADDAITLTTPLLPSLLDGGAYSDAEMHAAVHAWGLGDIAWDPFAMARRARPRASSFLVC